MIIAFYDVNGCARAPKNRRAVCECYDINVVYKNVLQQNENE